MDILSIIRMKEEKTETIPIVKSIIKWVFDILQK